MGSLWRTHSLLPSFRGRKAEPGIQSGEERSFAPAQTWFEPAKPPISAHLPASHLRIPGSASRPRNDGKRECVRQSDPIWAPDALMPELHMSHQRFEVRVYPPRGTDLDAPARMAAAALAATIDMNLPLKVPSGSRSSKAKDLARSSELNSLTIIHAGE